MLSKAYEWLTVVYPQKPTSEVVNARTATVSKALAELFEKDDLALLANYCVAAVRGPADRFAPDSILVTTLVEKIRAEQSAFPANLEENALELQIVAALVLGELMSPAARNQNRELSDLGAAMLLCLVECGTESTAPHLAAVIKELVGLATTTLEKSARQARKRVDLDLSELEGMEVPGDIPAFWKNLLPQLINAFNSLNEEAAKDREELEILWWMFNGFSSKLQQPLAALPVDVAAVACGTELAMRVLLPASSATAAMVEEATGRDRKSTQLGEKPIEDCASKWKQQGYDCLKPDDQDQREFVLAHPALFPLTWAAIRLDDSGGTVKWDGELGLKTGLDPKHIVTKAKIARQAFRERTCLRMVEDYPLEDEE